MPSKQSSPSTTTINSLAKEEHRGLVDRPTYRFLNTVSFWVSIFFIEGSFLFAIGAAASSVHLSPDNEAALVTGSYFAGSIAYTAGAYLSWFEVINLGKSATQLWSLTGSTCGAYWGSLWYLIGALAFNVNTTCGLAACSESLLAWVASIAGSLCFTLAAAIDCHHNRMARCTDSVFWLCFTYMAGSVLFLVGSLCSYPGLPLGHFFNDLTVNATFGIGAVFFLFGSWITLYMWKAEQFGLGFISEIHRNQVATGTDPKGVDISQQGFLLVYVILGVVSILDMCHTWYLRHDHVERGVSSVLLTATALSSLSSCLAAHAILWLATVVHRMPTLAPFGYLLWCVRLIAAVLLAQSSVRCASFYM